MSLFKPAWMSDNPTKAMGSVEKINDYQTLYDISTQAPYALARRLAISKIHDEELLFKIAVNSGCIPEYYERRLAISKIHDEELLYKIANSTGRFSEYDRACAVKGIRNPKLLMDLAQNAKTIQQIGGLMQSVKEHGVYGCVKTAAIDQIDSEEMLEIIACMDECDSNDLSITTLGYHGFQSKVIETAIDKIQDIDRLKRLAMSDNSYTTCTYAVKRLFSLKVGYDIFEDIARNAVKYDARKQAMTAMLGKAHLFDRELVAKLTDQDFLYDFAKNQLVGPNNDDQAAAVRKLTDSERVAEFTNYECPEVRRAASERLKELDK